MDLEGKVIRLRAENSKNGEGRTLPIEGELADIIERRKEARCVKMKNGEVRMSEYVFYRIRCGKVCPVGDFKKPLKTACEAAGLKYGRKVEGGKTFDDLRRTGVRNMVRAGMPEHTAMSISGHKTRSVFDRYNIEDDRDKRQALQKTQQYLKSVNVEQTVVPFPKASEG